VGPTNVERKGREARMVRQAHHERALILSLSKDARFAFDVVFKW
jgi:hypothetical protein